MKPGKKIKKHTKIKRRVEINEPTTGGKKPKKKITKHNDPPTPTDHKPTSQESSSLAPVVGAPPPLDPNMEGVQMMDSHVRVRVSPRATGRDMVRIRRFAKLVDAGEDEIEAYWQVISDPEIGFNVHRIPKPVRPPDRVLHSSLGALLNRVTPELMARARDAALSNISFMRPEATRVIGQIMRGKKLGHHKDRAAIGRLRLDASKLVLDTVGAGPPKGGNVNVAVQQQQNVVSGVKSVLDLMDANGWPKDL